ncbi:hypothetical protein LYNGBM3L_14320 [Moorena producens 3L]|uniref:Uncharacterized protein n=1 Tax=Moorena producens 3L TaxID=489825 RepID=F4XL94_9CYAN|nr:hypothetical protein LYNGBM3L_14320 [Moorena producens 3L]
MRAEALGFKNGLPSLDAKREWGKPRQSLMGGTPKTALPPQDRAASLPLCFLGLLFNNV